ARLISYSRAAEQRERALGQSEERFRSLVQYAADVILVLNPDGTIRYVGPSVKRILGYDAESLPGKNLADLVHPDDIDKFGHLLTEVGGREHSKPSGTGAPGTSGTGRELLRGLLEPRKRNEQFAGSQNSRERIIEEQ